MSPSTIYLDYASTCPRHPDIVGAIGDFSLHHYANVGRARYPLAEDAEVHYEASKRLIARWIDCQPIEVIYTYSATYAFNILALTLEHNKVLSPGDTVILSLSEHHANIVPWQMLAQRIGIRVRFV
jgi:selenocysteine lyase/cysteine desulfurase